MNADNESYQKLKDYAFRLLSIRPRSTKELSVKLLLYCKKKSIPVQYIQTLVDELTDRKYLSDLEFAKWWKEQRELHKPKGERVIKMELHQKGIPDDIADQVFLVNGKERNEREVEKALEVATRKLRTLKYTNRLMLKKKLSEHLFRRGFDWDTIGKVIDSLLRK